MLGMIHPVSKEVAGLHEYKTNDLALMDLEKIVLMLLSLMKWL